MCDVVVMYDAAVVVEDVEICCWSGEGDAIRANDEPERVDTGDVCVRMCRIGERGDFSRSGDCGSGEVEACREEGGEMMGEEDGSVAMGGGGRSGTAGRAW